MAALNLCAIPTMLLVITILCLHNIEVMSSKMYYLPGVAPHTFSQYDTVKMYVNSLTSTKTQMPSNYYSLPYCKPKRSRMQAENLGEVLGGDRIIESVYKLEMKVPKSCEIACVKPLAKKERQSFIKAVDDEYRVHWMLDNLPVGMVKKERGSKTEKFTRGFPVGFKDKAKQHFIYNHIRIIAEYHDSEDIYDDGPTSKIVGFRVEPMSINHKWEGNQMMVNSETVLNTCNDMVRPEHDASNYFRLEGGPDKVVYTYDVFWTKSETQWAQRWDVYLSAESINERIHWFSVTSSVMVIFFLTTMIAVILLRTLRRDITKYNDSASLEEANEESGWKLVHGDVFRPPSTYPMMFSVFVGSGVQLLTMAFATLTFAVLGLLSPANRGSLITALVMLYVFMGAFAGYYSSTVYKMFRGTLWQQNTIMTALLYPGVVGVTVFVMNVVLIMEGSTAAIPFTSFFTLLFLWFCVSAPLVFLGSFFGYKKEAFVFPVRTNQIPRAIPEQHWHMHPVLCCLVGGILPFGAASLELYFIMSALWLHHIYYIFGFLFLVVVVLMVTCAEVSILLTYFQLCAEDYRWWWQSFLTSGSSAVYLMLYSIYYNIRELQLDGLIPLFVYYSYMLIVAFTFFLLTGTIGYMASFWFNCQIYGSIKVD